MVVYLKENLNSEEPRVNHLKRFLKKLESIKEESNSVLIIRKKESLAI